MDNGKLTTVVFDPLRALRCQLSIVHCQFKRFGRSLCWATLATLGLSEATFAQFEFQPSFEEMQPAFTVVSPNELQKREAVEAGRKRDFQKAIDLVNQVLISDSQDHVAWYLRASARVEQGIFTKDNKLVRKGIADARYALQLGGNVDYYLPYLYGMTNLGALEQDPPTVELSQKVVNGLLDRQTISSSQRANFLYQRCFTYVQLSNPQAAIEDLENALKLSPDHLGAFTALAELCGKNKTLEESLAVYERGMKAFPQNTNLLNSRALLLSQRNRMPEALADFTKSLQIDPNFFNTYNLRAYTQMLQGEFTLAEPDLTQCLRLSPQNQASYTMRATCRIQQGKVAEALADYEVALQLAPATAARHVDAGFGRYFNKDYAGAIVAWDKAVELNPKLDFLMPWRFAASTRTAQAASDTATQVTANKVPHTRDWYELLTSYQQGQVQDGELLAGVTQNNEQEQDIQQSEAYYFIGLEKLKQKETDTARTFFEQALLCRTKVWWSIRGSKIALKELPAATAVPLTPAPAK